MIAPQRDRIHPSPHIISPARRPVAEAPSAVARITEPPPVRVPRDPRPRVARDTASSTESFHALTRDDATLVLLVLALLGGVGSAIPRPNNDVQLSARQREVIRLVARGMTNMQVAETLFISPRTVERHLTTIYNKLGISSRNAATRYALQHGLG